MECVLSCILKPVLVQFIVDMAFCSLLLLKHCFSLLNCISFSTIRFLQPGDPIAKILETVSLAPQSSLRLRCCFSPSPFVCCWLCIRHMAQITQYSHVEDFLTSCVNFCCFRTLYIIVKLKPLFCWFQLHEFKTLETDFQINIL